MRCFFIIIVFIFAFTVSGCGESVDLSKYTFCNDGASQCQDGGGDAGAATDLGNQADACAPQCEGKECGPDGCGGTCAECPEAAPYCVAGKCLTEDVLGVWDESNWGNQVWGP